MGVKIYNFRNCFFREYIVKLIYNSIVLEVELLKSWNYFCKFNGNVLKRVLRSGV